MTKLATSLLICGVLSSLLNTVNAQERISLSVAVENSPPWYFIKDDQELGVIPAVAKFVSHSSAIDIDVVPAPLKRALRQLNHEKLDLIASPPDPQLDQVATKISDVISLESKLYLSKRWLNVAHDQLPKLNIGILHIMQPAKVLGDDFDIQWFTIHKTSNTIDAIKQGNLDGIVLAEPAYEYFLKTGAVTPDTLHPVSHSVPINIALWAKTDRVDSPNIVEFKHWIERPDIRRTMYQMIVNAATK